jgi:hypothetical protein
MPRFDRREVSYTQARAELERTIADGSMSDLPEHDRDERIAKIVRGLQQKYPDLDDQLSRQLMGEGMRETTYHDPL